MAITQLNERPAMSAPQPVASALQNTPSSLGSGLVSAARLGNVGEIDRLLALGASPNAVSALDAFYASALHFAALRGHLEACERLIDAGADVNAPDSRGASPLYLATHNGASMPLVSLLLARGADPNGMGQKTRHGRWTCLHQVGGHGEVDMCRVLIDAGADVNFFLPDHGTPLHVAAYFGRASICELLILKGARTDTPMSGDTPAMLARKYGFDRVSELIDAMDKSRQAAEAVERVMAQGKTLWPGAASFQ